MSNYSRYQIFCRVLETGSFTRAATELGYSQSAVSQTVKALEQELGTVLFDRKKGIPALTKDGRELLPYLQAVSNAEKALERRQAELVGLTNSTIRIGAFTSVSRNLLPDLMLQFRCDYPGTDFVIRQGDYTSIPLWIRNGSIDFGFTNLDANTEDALEQRVLFQEQLLAVLPAQHPLAKQEIVTLEQLAKEQFILMDEGSYSTTLNAFSRCGINISPAYTVYDDYSILTMVRKGMGVSMLFPHMEQAIEDGIVMRPIWERPGRTLGLLWNSWDSLPYASRKFIGAICSRVNDNKK